VFLAVLIVLLLIFSGVIFKLQAPSSVFSFVGNIILCFACFAGARVLGRRQKRGGIRLGLSFAAAVILIIALMTLFTGAEFSFPGVISKSSMIITASLIGGISGVQ
jgi:putative membrane protein (TIGR04086 family)